MARGERPLNVVVCPNTEHPEAVAQVQELYEFLGCTVICEDANAHDRLMAQTHAMTFFIAKGLLDMGVDANAAHLPPSFQALARTLDAVRSDAGHLFFAIQHENPHAAAARWRLIDSLTNLAEQLDQTDIEPEKGNATLSIPNVSAPPELLEKHASSLTMSIASS